MPHRSGMDIRAELTRQRPLFCLSRCPTIAALASTKAAAARPVATVEGRRLEEYILVATLLFRRAWEGAPLSWQLALRDFLYTPQYQEPGQAV
jgi:hypothetical protein